MDRSRFRKRWVFAGVVVVLLGSGAFTYLRMQQNDGFTISRIQSYRSPDKTWSVTTPSFYERKEMEHILSQTFTYLNKGAQSYAFVSEDGAYVLKFFKQQHLRPREWLETVPLTGALDRWRNEAILRRNERVLTLFSSYKTAFEYLASESGMLFLHLTPTPGQDLHTTLIDKCGCRHKVALDGVEFVVQHRGVLVRSCLDRAVEAGDSARACRILDSVLTLLDQRTRKGFIDGDPAFLQNYGVVGDRVIQFDAGTVERSSRASTAAGYAQELVNGTEQLRQWLRSEHPDLAKQMDHKLWRCIAKREAEPS